MSESTEKSEADVEATTGEQKPPEDIEVSAANADAKDTETEVQLR